MREHGQNHLMGRWVTYVVSCVVGKRTLCVGRQPFRHHNVITLGMVEDESKLNKIQQEEVEDNQRRGR